MQRTGRKRLAYSSAVWPARRRFPTLGVGNTIRLSEPSNVNAINLAEKLATFTEHWQPRTIGQFNKHDLMVVKVKGEFVWHKHNDTDDFFLVLKGRVTIRMRDRNITLGPGELFVVPKGVEHCPVAEEEAHLLLIEPTGTPNTGNTETAAPRRVI
jgi:mannose-6-phosphate isomerase-like protein (cupin superfamily)